MKIGKTKRQRQSGIHAFSVLMQKWRSQDDSNNIEIVEESDNQNACISINKKTACVGFMNSVQRKLRIWIVMINKCVVISEGRKYKWGQVCVFPAIVSENCIGRGVIIVPRDGLYTCKPCHDLRKQKLGSHPNEFINSLSL